MTAIYYLFAAVMGAILGSFANVLIWRLPRGGLPWEPAHSYCPKCHAPIAFYDNIPIVSFLLLKGLCRHCRAAISRRYPFIEAAAACLALITAWKFGFNDFQSMVAAGGFLIFQTIILSVAMIDFKTYTIPDILSLGLTAAMILFAPFNLMLGPSTWALRIRHSILGAAVLGGLYYIFAFLGEKIYKQEAIGGGDVKLAAAIGAAFGWRSFFPIVILSSSLGVIYALPLLIKKRLGRKDPIPYGPFLGAAAVIYLWLGARLPLFLKFPISP
ncbi:MAG: prepilin peptidase [Elusimicrobia bacterium]|nr:prepilin peptidase [Elusimicrobiota bacterium]